MKEIKLSNGQTFYLDDKGRQYAICANCKKFIRINKFIFGSMHLCIGEE